MSISHEGWLTPPARPSAAARLRSGLTSPSAVTFCVAAAIGSRLVVWIAGLASLALFGHNPLAVHAIDPKHITAPFHSIVLNHVLAPGARWDSVWYLWIAQHGYSSRLATAFYPLYPLLVRAATLGFIPPILAGTAVSIAAFMVSLYLLYRLVRLDFDDRVARLTVLLVAVFPTSLFFSAVYTESLFLALSVGATLAARTDRWALAGLCGALAAATRSAGVLIVVPLAMLYLYGPAPGWRRLRSPRTPGWSAAALVLVPLGLLAYLGYLALAHGWGLAPFQVEVFWGRRFAGPIGGLAHALSALPGDLSGLIPGHGTYIGPGDPISWAAHGLIDWGFVAFVLAGLALAWRQMPAAYLAYAVLLFAQAVSYPTTNEPLQSISRYVVVIFPAFIGWGVKLAGSRRPVPWLAPSAAALVVLSGLWTFWAWLA
jgi:hypothetical protein